MKNTKYLEMNLNEHIKDLCMEHQTLVRERQGDLNKCRGIPC